MCVHACNAKIPPRSSQFYFSICLDVGRPKLNPVLLVLPNTCQVTWVNCIFWFDGCSLTDLAQTIICFLWCRGTVLACVWLIVHWDPLVHFSRAVSQLTEPCLWAVAAVLALNSIVRWVANPLLFSLASVLGHGFSVWFLLLRSSKTRAVP